MDKIYDIVVVGGGPIGISTSVILSKHGMRVALIERSFFGDYGLGPDSYNSTLPSKILCGLNNKLPSRLFALTVHTCSFLHKHDLIANMEEYGRPINRIRVEEAEALCLLEFLPQDIGKKSLGYMIEESILKSALYEKLKQSDVEVFEGYDFHSIGDVDISSYGGVEVLLRQARQNQGVNHNKHGQKTYNLRSNLLIAADGKFSTVKSKTDIKTRIKDYKQTALVCDISHTIPHNGTAFERFTDTGPIALLPKKDNNTSSVVWIESNDRLNAIVTLAEPQITQLMEKKVKSYAGNIRLCSSITFFGLKLLHSDVYASTLNRLVLVGDAAHSIHPLVGQGINLGFEDVEELVKILVNEYKLGLDMGTSSLLNQYSLLRRKDAKVMIAFTSGINRLFLSKSWVVMLVRRIGMNLVNRTGFLRKYFAMYASNLR